MRLSLMDADYRAAQRERLRVAVARDGWMAVLKRVLRSLANVER